MTINNKLTLFQEMIRCCHNLYFWTYDKDMCPLYSNCPNEVVVNNLFVISNNHEILLSYVENHRKPIILTNNLSLMWVAIPEKEESATSRIHLLGPFFVDSVSTTSIEANLGKLKLTPALSQEVIRFLHELPVISMSRVFEYAIMLYYCIYEECISISDLHYQESEPSKSTFPAPSAAPEAHGTYEAEQEMLRMVREGNQNYRTHMNKMAVTGNIGKLSNSDPIRQMKNAVLVCTTLFSRAAIDGGLAPELSLTLTDHYFQSVEACSSYSDLMEISHTMQEDFVQRVYRSRTRTISKPIMDCCDYIALHLEDELTLRGLAQLLNYSEYYLSRKFKQDMGTAFKDYIRQKRLERAKELLASTSMSIQDISEKLHFCSQSYFADAFRKSAGVSPTTWRESPR